MEIKEAPKKWEDISATTRFLILMSKTSSYCKDGSDVMTMALVEKIYQWLYCSQNKINYYVLDRIVFESLVEVCDTKELGIGYTLRENLYQLSTLHIRERHVKEDKELVFTSTEYIKQRILWIMRKFMLTNVGDFLEDKSYHREKALINDIAENVSKELMCKTE